MFQEALLVALPEHGADVINILFMENARVFLEGPGLGVTPELSTLGDPVAVIE